MSATPIGKFSPGDRVRVIDPDSHGRRPEGFDDYYGRVDRLEPRWREFHDAQKSGATTRRW